MAVPKRKTSPSKRGMRRSADALKAPTYVEDKNSGEMRRPHHIDLKTGMYRGRQVLKPKKAEFVGLRSTVQLKTGLAPVFFVCGARYRKFLTGKAPGLQEQRSRTGE